MDTSTTIMLVIVIVLIIAMFVTSYLKRKRYNNELNTMRNELKNGDRVMTDTGVVGELVDSYEEDGYKYFVLKSGKDKNVGYFAVHANAIYYVFGKEELANQNKQSKKEVQATNDVQTTDLENETSETENSSTENLTEQESSQEKATATTTNKAKQTSKNSNTKSKKSTKKSKK